MKKLALVTLLVASTAFAGNKDKADALFKQGKKLSAEKKYGEACPAFEQSMKLDPQIGTQLNIAKCYEDWGLLGKALVAYRAAEKLAHDAKDDREPKIKALIDDLDSNVPRLTIKLPKQATSEGVVVKLDNKLITAFGASMIVDPGPHTIEYTVDGGPKKQKTVPIERGGDSEVTLDVPKDRVVKKQPDKVAVTPVASTEPTVAPGHNQRLGGLVLTGAGVIAIGVSSLMTLSARGQYNDALEMYCNNAKDMCDPMGLEQTHDARSTANTATVIFIAGAAAVGGGVALYLLAPKAASSSSTESRDARYIVPSVTPDGAGVMYGGRF